MTREEAPIVGESINGSCTRTTLKVLVPAPQRRYHEPKNNPRAKAKMKQRQDIRP